MAGRNGERKSVCVWLEKEDEEAIRLITDYLEKQLWFPHWRSRSVAIRFALRRTVATLAQEQQTAVKRSRTLRRRGKKKPLVRKG